MDPRQTIDFYSFDTTSHFDFVVIITEEQLQVPLKVLSEYPEHDTLYIGVLFFKSDSSVLCQRTGVIPLVKAINFKYRFQSRLHHFQSLNYYRKHCQN